jgi:choline kinase
VRLSDSVFQTVILAAGNGSRLVGRQGVPKPLMTVGGVSLVAHALHHARASGCSEAVVVVGYEKERVKSAVQALDTGLRVRFVESPDPTAPNGVSLLAAESLAAPRFFLQMVDHLFDDVALPKLIASPLAPDEAGRVLIDWSPGEIDLQDATKVRVEGDRVRAIGKGLDPWDAVDAGCFVLTHAVFTALRQAPTTEPRTVSSGMRQLASNRMLGAASVNGTAWIDVDTPADRAYAETLLQQRLLRTGEGAAQRA